MEHYEAVRDAVLACIRSSRQAGDSTVSDAVAWAKAALKEMDPVAVEQAASEIVNDLYLSRIIIPGGKPKPNTVRSSNAYAWPCFHLTEHGEKVISETEYVPYDPSGYLGRLRSDIPGIDQDVVMYLDESLKCYGAGVLLSSAVMLGCASEKAMLQLIECFGQGITSDPIKRKQYEKDTEQWMVSQKYQGFMKHFRPVIPKLPKNLSQNIDVRLDQTFDLVRTTRNQAGHPTGTQIERGVIYGQLQIFPHYCKRVYELMDHFRNNPT